MIEFLYSIDRAIFLFINQTLSNPIGDVLWPIITDYNRILAIQIPLVIVWLLLLVKGGRTGRTVAIMIIPAIFLSDQFNSGFIKELVGRARPCHEVAGVQVIQGIHMLVDCGPGKSFPSSHAVNNFAVWTIFAYYFPRWKWWFLGWAAIVALSRPAVGVHYPSDILGGAVLGVMIAMLLIWAWRNIERQFFPIKMVSASGGKVP